MAALTLAEADQIIAGACAKMEEIGVKLTISVVDGRGDLIALARVDGASWRTPYISQGKAVASATWGLSSADMAARWTEPIFPGFMALQGGRFIPQSGRAPHLQGRRARRRGRRQRRHSPGGRRLRSSGHRISRLRNRRITNIMHRGNRKWLPLTHPICLILSGLPRHLPPTTSNACAASTRTSSGGGTAPPSPESSATPLTSSSLLTHTHPSFTDFGIPTGLQK